MTDLDVAAAAWRLRQAEAAPEAGLTPLGAFAARAGLYVGGPWLGGLVGAGAGLLGGGPAGAVAGGLVGRAAGGALAEWLGGWLEGRAATVGELGLTAGLSALPLPAVSRLAPARAARLVRALEPSLVGGGLAALDVALRQPLRTGDPATLGEIASGAAYGAILGGPISLFRLAQGIRPAPAVEEAIRQRVGLTAPPPPKAAAAPGPAAAAAAPAGPAPAGPAGAGPTPAVTPALRALLRRFGYEDDEIDALTDLRPVLARVEQALSSGQAPVALGGGPVPGARRMPDWQRRRIVLHQQLRALNPAAAAELERILDQYGYFEAARGGRVPLEVLEGLAAALPKRLGLPARTPLSSEETLGLAALIRTGARTLADLRAKLAQVPPTDPAARQALEGEIAQTALEVSAALQSYTGAAAEAGRALRAVQEIRLLGGTGSLVAALPRPLRRKVLAVADRIARLDPSTPEGLAAIAEAVRSVARPGVLGGVIAFARSQALTGVRTVIRNAVNSLNTPFHIAGTLGTGLWQLLTRAPEARTVPFDAWTLRWQLTALLAGLREGAARGRAILEHGLEIGPGPTGHELAGVATEAVLPQALAARLGPAASEAATRAMNYGSRVTRFFDALNYGMARGFALVTRAAALAEREAAAQKLTGPARLHFLDRRLAELVTDPRVVRAADLYAQHATFQEPLAGIGRWVQDLREMPVIGPLAQWWILFWKTPYNLIKQHLVENLVPVAALRRPAGPPEAPATILADAARGEALMRSLLAWTMLLPLGLWYLTGRLAVRGSGPREAGRRALWLDEGPPAAVLVTIGGQPYWMRSETMAPVNLPLAALANMSEQFFEGRLHGEGALTRINRAFEGLVQQVADLPFFQGLENLALALWGPYERQSLAEQLEAGPQTETPLWRLVGVVAEQARLLMPYAQLLRNVADAIDPFAREAVEPLDRFLVGLPEPLRPPPWRRLPPRVGVWGEPVRRDPGLGGPVTASLFRGFVVPVLQRAQPPDPLTARLFAAGVGLSPPGRTYQGVPLTGEEVAEWRTRVGRARRRALRGWPWGRRPEAAIPLAQRRAADARRAATLGWLPPRVVAARRAREAQILAGRATSLRQALAEEPSVP